MTRHRFILAAALLAGCTAEVQLPQADWAADQAEGLQSGAMPS